MNKHYFDQLPNNSPMQDWLAFFAEDEKGRYLLKFKSHHIGNPLIRSIHGGVTASLIEMCAEHLISTELEAGTRIQLVSSSLDYLRVSKDTDIQARANIVRIGKRMAFVDVWCWQDYENTPIARGTCTLRLDARKENS